MGYHFEIDGEVAVVHPLYNENEVGLAIDGVGHVVSLNPGAEAGEAILEIDGQQERVWLASRGDDHFIHVRGRSHRVVAINALERAQREATPVGASEILRAPMPGIVIEVSTEANAVVAEGEVLMTIESMKLQTAIVSPREARIGAVLVAAGDSFDQDAELVQLESIEENEGDNHVSKEDSR